MLLNNINLWLMLKNINILIYFSIIYIIQWLLILDDILFIVQWSFEWVRDTFQIMYGIVFLDVWETHEVEKPKESPHEHICG